MRIRSHLICCGVLSVTLAAASCSRRSNAPEYSLGYYNDTGAQITDVRSDWHAGGAAFHDEAGVLGVGGSGKASHEQPRPIPEKAVISWKTADGGAHAKEVAVAPLLDHPETFTGTIFFKFTVAGDVKVVPMTYARRDQLAAQGKPAIP